MSDRATIFALATAPGRAAVAVIRASGPACSLIAERMLGGLPEPRYAALRTIKRPTDGAMLDEALALYFPAPHSFTGEDCLEFQTHGGRSVVSTVLAALGEVPGCRIAEPGEFTKRAVEAGKLDIDAAEGLADLIDADTYLQQRRALQTLQRALNSDEGSWRTAIVHALSILEATFEFADDAEVSASIEREVVSHLTAVLTACSTYLKRSKSIGRLKAGFDVVLAGPPNAGKSTLMNCLSKRDVSITSEWAGTTRDLIETPVDIAGFPVILIDSAGIRFTSDPIERLGVERTISRVESSGLVLWVDENRQEPRIGRSSAEIIKVHSKCDLHVGTDSPDWISVSARTGLGLERLISEIGDRLAKECGQYLEGDSYHSLRLQRAAQEIMDATSAGLQNLEYGYPDLAAVDLRNALESLDSLCGETPPQDVLDAVFARFCLGK